MPAPPNSVHRIAHLADIHVREGIASEGLIRALSLAESLGAQAVLFGGDLVMNSVSSDISRVEAQWDEFHRARAKFPHLPVYPCLGNQDVWGWNQKSSRCTGDEPLFGKGMFARQMGIPSTYYATQLGEWRLIVLDSIQRGGRHGFFASLGESQREWLERELADDPVTPTVIVSHIPMVPGPAEFFASEVTTPDKSGLWCLPNHLVHSDSHVLASLFSRNSNVRLCLSGHTHLAQRILLWNTTYVVSPPVGGAWWRGDFLGEAPGFSLIDLGADGSFDVQTIRLSEAAKTVGE